MKEFEALPSQDQAQITAVYNVPVRSILLFLGKTETPPGHQRHYMAYTIQPPCPNINLRIRCKAQIIYSLPS
jgi:hypothetical protein